MPSFCLQPFQYCPFIIVVKVTKNGLRSLRLTPPYCNSTPEERPENEAKEEQPAAKFREILRDTERQLREYFSKKRKNFSIPLDLQGATPFQLAVWAAIQAIPYGQTRTYKKIAQRIGNIYGVRAVGNACGQNRIPIIVPCHRVIRSDGKLGGYSAGLEIKRFLLKLESS